MNFINQYKAGSKNQLNAEYAYAEEFLEKADEGELSVIYAVGKRLGKALVTKTDTAGEVIWERSYDIGGPEASDYIFEKIIRLRGNSENIDLGGPVIIGQGAFMAEYVLYATDTVNYQILGISNNGDVAWAKSIPLSDPNLKGFLQPCFEERCFFLVFSRYDFSGSSYPVVLKFNSSGRLLDANEINYNNTNLIVTAADSYAIGLVLGCNYEDALPESLILNFNNVLGINEAFHLFLSTRLDDLKMKADGTYLVAGYTDFDSDNKTYIANFPYPGVPDQNIAYLVPWTSGMQSKLCLWNDDEFYLLQYNDTENRIHRINGEWEINWSKAIVISDSANDLSYLNYSSETNTLTFTGTAPGAYESHLIHTDEGLNSCKTIDVAIPFYPYDSKYGGEAISITIESLLLRVEDRSLQLQDIVPAIHHACGIDIGDVIDFDDDTNLQSPAFYLQAAGSTGDDGSAEGIHLRWIFGGGLGEKHLPKGEYSQNSYNFNKPDDFVRIYRAPYYKSTLTLDLSGTPYLTDDLNKVWMYRVNQKVFYVYFRNATKYNIVRNSIVPANSPAAFISAYGSEIIEIENKREMFFAANLRMDLTGDSGGLKVETLSVDENALAASKTVTSRKSYLFSELGNVHLLCENGRSIRYRSTGCFVKKIVFEFYSDFIKNANERHTWHYIDRYALTLHESEAFYRLEPESGIIDGSWPRYNQGETVRINNYKDKWDGFRESWDRNIRDVVDAYLQLSEDSVNPRALENVPLGSESPDSADFIELSNLDLLNIAAYDFHVARMLGLGTLDLSESVYDGQYIYVAQYFTKKDLLDGGGTALQNLVSMSLPTGLSDQRLPLPVNLKELKPGAFFGNESPEPVSLTDANGYSHDGSSRYITIYSDPLPEDDTNKPFYISARLFDASTYTNPVYAGIEYKKNNEIDWQKPELPNDIRYTNNCPQGETPQNETLPLGIPEDQNPLFIHQERVSGIHYYSSYGINWFSRAISAEIVLSVQTDIVPANPLKPPTDIRPLLIRPESPLLLTSPNEQIRLNAISGSDKTLIRLSFEYNAFQELLDYKIPDGADINNPSVIPAENTEIFADKIDILFRNRIPANVAGKIISVHDDPTNIILSVIDTGDYTEASTGNILHPTIAPGQESNFAGGVFIIGDQQFIIYQVTGYTFTVFKKEISSGIITNDIPSPTAAALLSPVATQDGLFMAVENMQNLSGWSNHAPLPFNVTIGSSWNIHREIITINNDDGTTEQHLEKTRGFWDDAVVEAINEPVDLPGGGVGSEHRGSYKFSFNNLILAEHPQFNLTGDSVEWYQGIIRVHTSSGSNGTRKVLRVVRLENVGSASKLIVYAYDETFMSDSLSQHIPIGASHVNFYPGYKAYLYRNDSFGLNYENILPAEGEGVRYSILGLRSRDIATNLKSRISPPQMMFAQEQVEAIIPEAPQGSLYATRPDFFGRSTYSFKTKYAHKPYGVLYYRSNDEALLNALYEKNTVKEIRENLKVFGGNDEEYLTNRWQNFLDFALLSTNLDYLPSPPINPANPAPQPDYKFPNPDKQSLFDWANDVLTKLGLPNIPDTPGTLTAGDPKIVNFVKGAIYNAFVPLTEVPILYGHIPVAPYQPKGKKQVLRDRNGNVLQPNDPAFDMAPMMKITGGSNYETLFADFTLDGTSGNIYFYGAKELNTQMKMSDFSKFLGPVKLVNSNPPEAPQIKRIMPELKNESLGIMPSIQIELNAYPEVQKVRKVNIYRSLSKLDAQSVNAMKLIKTIDLEAEGILNSPVWKINDDFSDLPEVPYSDPLFYRLSASRKVEYDDVNGNVITEYAPSQSSKITATLIVEAVNPLAPIPSYSASLPDLQGNISGVLLTWEKSCYKAKYHVYKMNNSGNWVKIGEVISNENILNLSLQDTDITSDVLPTKDAEGNNVYSHFKIVAENTSGMLSLEENILTIPS
jgi:hypothetical protein